MKNRTQSLLRRERLFPQRLWTVLATLFLISALSYALMLRPGYLGIAISFTITLFIVACAGITLCSMGTTASVQPGPTSSLNLLERRVARLWWATAIAVLIATVDLMQSVYLTTLLRDEVSLGTVRSDFFTNEDFRSLTGRVSGLFFIPFALLTGLRYKLGGHWGYVVVGLLMSAAYSLLMGGRGQIIFFLLAVTPALMARISIIKLTFLMGGLFYALALIYAARTPDATIANGLSSIFQYMSTPWRGLEQLLLSNDRNYRVDALRLGAPFLLDEVSFPIYGNQGNLYGGFGHLVHTFGLIGAPFYIIFMVLMFVLASRIFKHSTPAMLLLQHTAFLYFGFMIFHDLTIFYPSFMAAIVLLPLLSQNDRRQRRATS